MVCARRVRRCSASIQHYQIQYKTSKPGASAQEFFVEPLLESLLVQLITLFLSFCTQQNIIAKLWLSADDKITCQEKVGTNIVRQCHLQVGTADGVAWSEFALHFLTVSRVYYFAFGLHDLPSGLHYYIPDHHVTIQSHQHRCNIM